MVHTQYVYVGPLPYVIAIDVMLGEHICSYDSVIIRFCILAETVPPPGVSVVPNGCDSAEVTWRAPNSRMCDGIVPGYNVRYQLSSSTGDYTSVSTSDAPVILNNLTPNEEYTVEVAIITSVGGIGSYSPVAWFNITGNS